MIVGLDANEANVKNRVGSGVYALNLLREFSITKDYLFLVFLKEKPIADLPKENKNFKYIVFGPKKLWTRIALPIKLAFTTKIDIFFTLGHYGPRFSRIPYAVTIFDLSYLRYPKMFKKNDLYQLVNWSKRSIAKSKHIFTISNSSKQDIVKNYKINPKKITVTYPGYDEKRFKPQPQLVIQKAKNKYKIMGDYIIFVGTLQPRKNIETLIEALASIVHSSQNLQLVIAGKKGWLYDSIFAKVKDLKLEDKVVFTDYVSDNDVPALISGAKAYILPSLWEGFGIPVVEAQACGVPVVVSNVSSLPEVIGAINYSSSVSEKSKVGGSYDVRTIENEAIISGSGVLVNPESVDSIAAGIKKVLTNTKTRSDLVTKGFTNTKRFSWQKCATQTLKVLEKLTKAKRSDLI